MAQVDTHSAFRHSSQHSNYYYPSTSPNHSSSSSSSNSRHSSPRTASTAPQRYYSPSQCYSPPEDHSSYHYRNFQPPPRQNPPIDNTRSHEEPDYSFPAYERVISSETPTPKPIEEEEEEDDKDDYEVVESGATDSPNSLKSASQSVVLPHISDDIWTERGPAPSRQVDYLSHDWQEPDIWSSWRYIRKEKAGYPQNGARLENASWRTWAKSKYKLKTITPETLNWFESCQNFVVDCFRLKDCDVTWLYGPLQSQVGSLVRAHTEPASPATSPSTTPRHKMSRSSSFNTPSKPILKKRSYSEVMLTSFVGKTHGNLLTRAAQAVQEERQREMEEKELREEQRKNPLTPTHVLRSQQRIRRKGSTDLASISLGSPESPFVITQISTSRSEYPVRTDYFGANWTSTSNSGGQTPSASKHIHFNDLVEQCIAVDIKDDDLIAIDDESEDEGLFMRPRHPPKIEHSTIAKLPATTLRPGDEPSREPPQVIFNVSQELEPSSGFYYEEGGGFSSSASPPEFPPRFEDPIDDFSFDHPFTSSASSENSIPSNTTSSTSSSDINLDEENQRRASVAAIPIPTARSISSRNHRGMAGEDDDEGIGIVGLAADAISTAKDLVGVLWNAGWGGRR